MACTLSGAPCQTVFHMMLRSICRVEHGYRTVSHKWRLFGTEHIFFPRIYVIVSINIRAYFHILYISNQLGPWRNSRNSSEASLFTQTPTAMLGFWPLPPSVGYDKVLWALVKIILTRMRVCQVMREPCINYFVLLYTQELSAICDTDNSSKLKGVGAFILHKVFVLHKSGEGHSI